MSVYGMVRVTKIEGKGLSLIANERITEGAIIASGPAAQIPVGSLDGTPLSGHPMAWGEGEAICWGLPNLANHSDNPNCSIDHIIEHGRIDMIAARNIEMGEELTINYECPLWFTPAIEEGVKG